MHTSEFFEQTTIQDPWSEVPAEDWNNWKWQLKNRITSLEQLESLLELSPEEREGCLLANKKLSLTPPNQSEASISISLLLVYFCRKLFI